jgi:RNA polymerase sigma-70 factor, ECF subfamily
MLSVIKKPLRAESDRRLVERCQAGERLAQVELFRSEVQRVHAILYRVLGGSNAVEDMIQETFIRVFRSLAQFRGEAQLSTWIGRITLNVAMEHLRTRRFPTARLESVPDVSRDESTGEEKVAAREALRQMYEILERLDPKHRVAFTLHVIDGRPLTEVASLMSATLVATKTRVWRARREIERRAQNNPWLSSFLDSNAGGRS